MKTPSSARHRRAWRPTRAGTWAGSKTLVQLICVCYLTLAGSLTFWTLLPLIAGWQPSVIVSGSMQPVIAPGDVVVTAKVDQTPGPGAVVMFDDPIRQGEFTTHRVVEITDDGLLVTKGDANQSADSTPISPEAVRGQGRLVVPAAGLPRLWWSTDRTTFGLWAGLTALAVIVVSRMPQADPEWDEVLPSSPASSGAPPEPSTTDAVGTADATVEGGSDVGAAPDFEPCGFTPGLPEPLPHNASDDVSTPGADATEPATTPVAQNPTPTAEPGDSKAATTPTPTRGPVTSGAVAS